MGAIHGYNVEILRNGSAVRWKSARVGRSKEKAAVSWSVTLQEPMNISAADTWTIRRGLGGYAQTLVDAATSDKISGEDGFGTATRTVGSSESGGDVLTRNLLEYCIPKTLVYYNPDWLTEDAPTARLIGGIIRYGVLEGWAGALIGTTPPRYYHPRLPGKQFQDTDFQCIPAKSHYDITAHLCGLVGVKLRCNTPNLELIDTCTFEAGTTWYEAMTRNHKIWSPQIELYQGTLYISDVIYGELVPGGPQKLSIGNPAIVSTSFTNAGAGGTLRAAEAKDSLVVTGRKTKNSTSIYDPDPDYTPITLASVSLSADETYTTSFDMEGVLTRKRMDEFKGSFGLPSEKYDIKQIVTHSKVTKYHVSTQRGGKKIRTPVQETTDFIDSGGQTVGRTIVYHYYTAGLRPVYTVEEEYIWTNLPGSAAKDLRLVRCKITDQTQVIRSVNQTLTSEIIEELVMYYETNQGGTTYYTEPVSFADFLRGDATRTVIETNANTTQRTMGMTVHQKKTMIDRASEGVLIKHDFDHDVLSGTTRSNSQVLENPVPFANQPGKDDQFRKEYHTGIGKMIGGYGPCYHAPATINHEDISTDAVANEIARRYFAKNGPQSLGQWTERDSITIKTPVMIPIDTIGFPVTLPSFTQNVNGTNVTVPGGDFTLVAVSESMSCDAKGNIIDDKYEQLLTVQVRPHVTGSLHIQ